MPRHTVTLVIQTRRPGEPFRRRAPITKRSEAEFVYRLINLGNHHAKRIARNGIPIRQDQGVPS